MIGDNNLRQNDAQTASLATRKNKLPLTETEETMVGPGVDMMLRLFWGTLNMRCLVDMQGPKLNP